MYFNKIRIAGHFATIDLPVIGLRPSDPYQVRGIDGLGPPDMTLHMSDSYNQVSSLLNREYMNRLLVFRIGLNPNYSQSQTVADLRSPLYSLMTPGVTAKAPMAVYLMHDDVVVALSRGHVRGVEPNPFSKDPEAIVTFQSTSPYWLGYSITETLTWDGGFHVHNPGDAPAGFNMRVFLTQAAPTGFAITLGQEHLAFQQPFLAGDEVEFSTFPGNRWALLDRGGVGSHLMNAMPSWSVWLQLHGGENILQSNILGMNTVRISYTPQYWGV